MSDISIPGVQSKYGTEKLIEDLMKLERLPKTRAEERLTGLQLEKTVWLDLNRRLSRLRDSSREMFSFQNPFNDRIANSSDESVLSASASREAMEETRTLVVKQTASADRFMSNRLPVDYRIPSGNYTFKVGESTMRLSFSGGTMQGFVDAINRKSSDTIKAQLVAVTADTRVMVIESMKPGAGNKLLFTDDSEKLALDLGIVERAASSLKELPVDPPARFERPLDTNAITVRDGTLLVGAGSEAALRLGSSVPTRGLVMELEVELVDRPGKPQEGPPPGPSIPLTGAIEYEGIRVQSAPSEAPVPEWTPPPVQARRDNPNALYLLDGSNRAVSLPPLESGPGFKKLTLPLPAYADSVLGLGIRNENTDSDVRVRSVRIFDPTETGGFRPKNAVSTAGDAVVLIDGIEVVRPTNSIDDLIPGVTLNLQRPSETPVKLDIEPNREAAKEAIIELVGTYNLLLTEINILSRNEPTVIDEISFRLSEEEKKTYTERLGIFQGDSTLSQIRTRLQGIMMGVWPTGSGPAVLSSFGISTDSRRGGGYDASRLRGYLEIEEKTLDTALEADFRKVRDSFGYDSDGDLIIDSGAAFAMDALMRPYVETGGIIASRTRTIDTQVARQERDIENFDRQLASKEAELKRKYGLMEGALGQMESSASAWDNFGKQNE
jgi:flagellar hook-associated protein 2